VFLGSIIRRIHALQKKFFYIHNQYSDGSVRVWATNTKNNTWMIEEATH